MWTTVIRSLSEKVDNDVGRILHQKTIPNPRHSLILWEIRTENYRIIGSGLLPSWSRRKTYMWQINHMIKFVSDIDLQSIRKKNKAVKD